MGYLNKLMMEIYLLGMLKLISRSGMPADLRGHSGRCGPVQGASVAAVPGHRLHGVPQGGRDLPHRQRSQHRRQGAVYPAPWSFRGFRVDGCIGRPGARLAGTDSCPGIVISPVLPRFQPPSRSAALRS